MDDEKDSAHGTASQPQEALFQIRVIGIPKAVSERITKRIARFFKGHAVFPPVESGFIRIPFKVYGFHMYNVQSSEEL